MCTGVLFITLKHKNEHPNKPTTKMTNHSCVVNCALAFLSLQTAFLYASPDGASGDDCHFILGFRSGLLSDISISPLHIGGALKKFPPQCTSLMGCVELARVWQCCEVTQHSAFIEHKAVLRDRIRGTDWHKCLFSVFSLWKGF